MAYVMTRSAARSRKYSKLESSALRTAIGASSTRQRLRRAIRLDGSVELEVLARHRRHHRDVEPAVARPSQRQRMGRGLHHDAVVAGVDHAREQLLQLERLRRRVAVIVRNDLVEDPDLDRPDLARMPSAAPQHLRGQGDHGRLAVSARYPDDGQLVARSAEPRIGGVGKGIPAVRHHQLRDAMHPRALARPPPRSRRSRWLRRRSRARQHGRPERRRTACPGVDAPRVVCQRRDLPDRDADHPFGADDVSQCPKSHAHRRNPRSQPRAMPVAARSR